MNCKILAVIPLAVFVFSSPAINANPEQKIEKCPSAQAIRAKLGNFFIMPETFPDGPKGYWYGYDFGNNFETPQTWGYGIGSIKAKDQQEAYEKIKYALDYMSLTEGPTTDKSGCTICEYKNANGDSGQAVTPFEKCK